MVMVMGGREKRATGMMTGMADMGTQIVVMEIVMAEIMKNAITEMVIRMMITVEEVEVLMISSMAQEVGALIETGTVLLMMMLNIHHEAVVPELMTNLWMEGGLIGNFLNRILALLQVMKKL
jgi:hypothetical protein